MSKTGSRLYGKIISLFICFIGLIFMSLKLTGNVIGNLDANASGLIGASLFIVGIISAFVYFNEIIFSWIFTEN